MSPVSDPHVYSAGILAPRLFEALKLSFRGFEAGSPIDPLELGCICLVVFRRDVLYGIADQVDNAALDDNIFENGFGTLLLIRISKSEKCI